MKAFLGKTAVKTKYLKRVEAHRKADEILQGIYWEDGKGCAVGCTVETSSSPHEAMEKELGIPKELAYLEDVLFEELKNGEAKLWPERFLKAIKPGADLSLVVPKFIVWQFEDKKVGLKNLKEVKEDKEVYGFCEEVVGLYKRIIDGEKVTEKEFYELYLKIDRAGAWARARAGAWARAWAGAWAWARAWAWAWAWARARAWAWAWAGADYDKNILLMADKLIELLKEA